MKTHQQELDDLDFTFIELPKFNVSEKDVSTLLEKWVYFIKHAEDLEVIPPMRMTRRCRRLMRRRSSSVGRERIWKHTNIEESRYRMKGRVEGERQKAIETARRMKADGLEVDLIARYTGLALMDIESL